MPKKINVGLYEILDRHENKIAYDVLLCKACQQTCKRCNFTRHKSSPRHIAKTVSPIQQIVNILENLPFKINTKI